MLSYKLYFSSCIIMQGFGKSSHANVSPMKPAINLSKICSSKFCVCPIGWKFSPSTFVLYSPVTVSCSLLTLQYIVLTLQKLWSIDLTIWSIDLTVWSIDLTIWSIDLTIWSIDLTVWSIDLTIWSSYILALLKCYHGYHTGYHVRTKLIRLTIVVRQMVVVMVIIKRMIN